MDETFKELERVVEYPPFEVLQFSVIRDLEDGDHPGFDQYQAAQAPSPVEDWTPTCTARKGNCAMCHGYGECFATYGMQEADRPK
jgi:hypothetical protein